ncbi:MAG: hypothetical protein KJ902_04040, partial [Candidatus Omnitrophica bacterium]|nr:hypothetical protein [Candidatus Omnitrophota bacterium]
MFFNPYSLLPLIISLIHLIIGFFIFVKNQKSIINRTFALECIAVSIWLFGYFIAYSCSEPKTALFWCKFAYFGVMFIPVFFYHFTVSFFDIRNKKFIILNYLITSIFVILVIVTDKVVSGVYKFYWGYQAKAGFVNNLFLSYFVTMFIYCLLTLYLDLKGKRRITPIEYTKTRYVLVAYMIASLGI